MNRKKTKEELELELLQDLDLDLNIKAELNSKDYEKITDFINYLEIYYPLKVLEVDGQKKVILTEPISVPCGDEKIEFNSSAFYLEKLDNNTIKEGELCCLIDNYRSSGKLLSFNKEILEPEFLKECVKRLEKVGSRYSQTINLEVENEKELNKEVILKEIMSIEKDQEEREQARIEREKETEESKRERVEKENKYLTLGEWEDENIKVEGKEIQIKNTNLKIILNKPAKEVLNCNEFFHSFSWNPKRNLIDKEISFALFKNGKKDYEIEYGQRVKINGIQVRRSKILFITNRLENVPNSDVKLLNEITGIGADLLSMNKINLEGNTIPIILTIKNIKTKEYLINIFDVEKPIDYNLVTDLFIIGRSVRNNLGFGGYKKLVEFLGVPKQDIYDYLKKMRLLNSLNNSNQKD